MRSIVLSLSLPLVFLAMTYYLDFGTLTEGQLVRLFLYCKHCLLNSKQANWMRRSTVLNCTEPSPSACVPCWACRIGSVWVFITTICLLVNQFFFAKVNRHSQNFLRNSYEILMNFLQTSYELLTKFLWTFYKLHMTYYEYLMTSYEYLMNFLQTSYIYIKGLLVTNLNASGLVCRVKKCY